MTDISAIASFAASVRAAVEITKAMKDVRDANLIQTKVFELTREIMAAQSYALEAMATQSDLLAGKRELEEKYPNLKHGMQRRAATNLRASKLELRSMS